MWAGDGGAGIDILGKGGSDAFGNVKAIAKGKSEGGEWASFPSPYQ